MPTLTPKRGQHRGFTTAALALDLQARLRQLVTTTPERKRSNGAKEDDDDDDGGGPTTTSSSTATTSSAGIDATHLSVVLAALQGLLAVVLVYHSFRAIFFPCAAFGPSAANLRDLAVCDSSGSDNSWDIWSIIVSTPLLFLPTPTFCMSALYLISGFRQGHLWWKASIDTIRSAVVTRLAYLLLLGAAVTFLTAVVDTTSTHHQRRVSMITGSLWLTKRTADTPFHGVVDLIHQMVWWAAAVHDDHNTALSYLSLELMGTVLVAGLVLLLKGSPHRLRSRWMMILLVALLVPSVTRTRRFDLRVHVERPHDDRSLLSSENDHTRSIGVDPLRHAHILAQIFSDNNDKNPMASSALRFSFAEHAPDSWYNKKKVNDGESRALHLDDSTSRDNAWLLDELYKAADGGAVHGSVSTPPWIEGAVGDKWGTEAPWIMSSSFVVGVWISEAVLSSSFQRVISSLPAAARPYVGFAVFPLAALLCGSYPDTDPLVTTNPVWRMMRAAAGHLGFTDVVLAQQLWSVVGATLLMLSVVVCSLISSSAIVPVLKRLVPQHNVEMVVDAWSKIALSLFLVHLPILHYVGCGGFLFFRHYTEEVFWAASLAALVSTPIYLTAAVLFNRLIDRPAQVLSAKLSRQLLGLPPTTITGCSSSFYYPSNAPGSNSNESSHQQKQQP
jgi:hypothetical protein